MMEPIHLLVSRRATEEQNIARTTRLYEDGRISLEAFEWRIGHILAADLPAA